MCPWAHTALNIVPLGALFIPPYSLTGLLAAGLDGAHVPSAHTGQMSSIHVAFKAHEDEIESSMHTSLGYMQMCRMHTAELG